ncbi:MAG TPA: HEAT repeat domain-containing protein [Terriglobales bacterium]|nr:HEAT repeat domain-containing protein [Terriglobales bacterium]
MLRRLLVPLALGSMFFVGWVVGGGARPPAADPDRVARLEQQVTTLQARLRAREDVAASRPPTPALDHGAGATATVPIERAFDMAARPSRATDAPATLAAPAPRDAAVRATPAAAPSVDVALDRFYRYLEATTQTAGRDRWRQARDLLDELRAMGPVAGRALMQVLASGTDTDERRSAARLLGQLQVAAALPVLRDVVEKEHDLLLRRAAASGLRQLQTPESLPVLERLVAQPAEDRFVRLSASIGLAESGRPLGVAGLAHIFEEANSDGRGRDMAFRALANLKDERPLPFMRQVLTSQAEPSYRLQAIRYVTAQGDQQALASLHVLMHAPNEQPSIRDAAAQAHAAISARK